MRDSQGSSLQELTDWIFSQRATKGQQLRSSGRRGKLKLSLTKIPSSVLEQVSWEVRVIRKIRQVVAQEPEQDRPSWNQVLRRDYQGLQMLTLKSRGYTPSYPRTEASFSIILETRKVPYC